MANTIDSGQPLQPPRPGSPVGPAHEARAAAPVNQNLSAAAHSYLQQAKQDVADIRQLGAPPQP